MRLFIDTANVDEIREVASWGVISGVTTNPSLIAKEGRDFKQVIEEISAIVNGPISAEVISEDAEGMVEEALELVKISNNIVIKIPMTSEGLKAVSVLAEKDIKTNVTLIFSPLQGLLAARAGASYVSPFIGRIDDIGTDGVALVEQMAEMFNIHNIDTEIIAASIRSPKHVIDASMAGSDIGTIPYKVFKQMLNHPLTDSGIRQFLSDWEKAIK